MARRASGLGLLLLAAGVGEAAGVVPCTRIRGVPGARRWCGGGPGAGVIDGRAGFGSAPEARRLPRLVLRLRGGGSDTAPGRRAAEPASTGAGVGRGGGGLGCPRVFAAGGFVIGFGHSLVTDVVESYSPDRGGWRKEPALPLGISGCRAETLSGSIYVMGGQDARFVADDEPKAGGAAATDEHGEPETIDACVWPTLDTVFRLDSTRGEWLPAPPMLHRRTCFGSAAADGRIYVAGGFDGEEFVHGVESFDPREPRWRRLPNFPRPRSALAMTAVQAGGASFLVACGGIRLPGGISDEVDIFDTRKGAWVAGPALLGERSGAAAASIDFKVYMMGGVSTSGALAGVDVLDLRTLTWERDLTDAMKQPRTSLAAVTCGERIVAIGGYDESGLPVDTVELYEPSVGWSEGRSLSFARGLLGAALY